MATDTSARGFVDSLLKGDVEHHGVKGQKWGVRRADAKFERKASSFNTFVKVNNAAAKKYNETDLIRINNKPEYKGKDFNKPSALRTKYAKEHTDAFTARLDEAASDLGTNASGTRKYTVHVDDQGAWGVTTEEVKHADEAFTVNVEYDSRGFITRVLPLTDEMAQAENFVDDFLAHHGVKGQKWGVRRSRAERVAASSDSTTVKAHRSTAKSSGVKALSNKELEEVVRRMNLEQQYKRLSAGDKSRGRKLVESLLGDMAKQHIADLAPDHADAIRAGLNKK